jgi:5-methylthioadenosine/S-adenosylhomocysteine deaminase
MYDLVIQGARVMTDMATALPALQDIALQDGRIAALAPQISAGLARQVLAADGLTALPGAVNAHAHLAMSLFRGVAEDLPIERWFNQVIWPLETNLTEEDVYWGALLGCLESLRSGVTTVADHYFFADAVAAAVERSGIRALLAPTLFSGPQEAADLARARQFVAQRDGSAGGRIRSWLGPHAPYTCTPEYLRAVAAAARELNVGIHIHLSETAEQVRACRTQYGLSPVALAAQCGLFDVPTIAAHAAHTDAADRQLLAQHGTAVAVTPQTEMKLAIGVAPVIDYQAAGITVALGSDGAASNNHYDLTAAARLIALLEKHRTASALTMPLAEALQLPYQAGAAAVGLAGQIGIVAVGAAADIALYDFNGPQHAPLSDVRAALLYSAQPTDVRHVLVGGRIVLRDGLPTLFDQAQVLREAAVRSSRLQQPGSGRMAAYPGN